MILSITFLKICYFLLTFKWCDSCEVDYLDTLVHLWFGCAAQWIVGNTSSRCYLCLSVPAEGESQ